MDKDKPNDKEEEQEREQDYSGLAECGITDSKLKLVLLEYTYSPYHPESKSPKARAYCDGADKETFYFQAWGGKTLQRCDFETLLTLVKFTGLSYAGMFWEYGYKSGTGPAKFKRLIDDWNGVDPIKPFEIPIPVCGN